MSITRQTPRTVYLGGPFHPEINDVKGSVAITPGFLIERFNNSGVQCFRPHSTAGGPGASIFALDYPEMNKSIDDAYVANDLIKALVAQRGTTLYIVLASGNNVAIGDYLESNGDGSLRKFAAGTKVVQCLEAVNSAGAPARCRVEVI